MIASILVVVMAQDWLGPQGPEVFHKATPVPKVAESSSSQQEPTKILGLSLPAMPSLSLPKLETSSPSSGSEVQAQKEFKWSITSSLFRQDDDGNSELGFSFSAEKNTDMSYNYGFEYRTSDVSDSYIGYISYPTEWDLNLLGFEVAYAAKFGLGFEDAGDSEFFGTLGLSSKTELSSDLNAMFEWRIEDDFEFEFERSVVYMGIQYLF
jgi:hypothetical protein